MEAKKLDSAKKISKVKQMCQKCIADILKLTEKPAEEDEQRGKEVQAVNKNSKKS